MVRPKSALAVLREQLGLTQMELAARLGISQGELSYYETGQKIPSGAVMSALEKVFPEVETPTDLLLSYPEYVERMHQREDE
jgi:transcriptional regulator with XRE-family HTH domain